MQTRQQLLDQLRRLPTPRQEPCETVPLASETFRALFPSGIRRGTLTEWLSEERGSGVESLTLKLVSALDRGIIVVVDSRHDFYPLAASALGVPLSDTIIINQARSSSVGRIPALR